MENDPLPRFLRKPAVFLGRDDFVNKEFLRSASGLLKIGQIVTLTTSVVSLARHVTLQSSVTAVDIVFFASAVLLCLMALCLFSLFLFHCHEKITCRKSAVSVIVTVIPGVSAGLLLVLSILLTREAVGIADQFSAKTNDGNSKEKCDPCSKVNTAAIFGYLSWFFFAVDFVLLLRRCGKVSSTPVQSVIPQNENEPERSCDRLTQGKETAKEDLTVVPVVSSPFLKSITPESDDHSDCKEDCLCCRTEQRQERGQRNRESTNEKS